MRLHPRPPRKPTVRRGHLAAVVGVLAASLTAASGAWAATSNQSTQFAVTGGSLSFVTAPVVPNFPTVTLNGQAQNDRAQMNAFAVNDATGSGAGWNVTSNGDAGTSKSAVFAQYCSNGGSPCGSDPANSYVGGGASLPASSLTLDSTGAAFTGQGGSSGTPPGHQCGSGCSLDVPSSSPTKIVSAIAGAGMGTWQANSYGGTSLTVAVPANITVLPANEVYRLDILWTLNSGP